MLHLAFGKYVCYSDGAVVLVGIIKKNYHFRESITLTKLKLDIIRSLLTKIFL